jgi:2'-5' RNA ligase
VRLFLAINFPAEVRHTLFEATASLRAAAPRLTWVREPMLHLTLKFLDDQSEEMANRVADAMRAVGARHRVVEAALGGVGAFPNFRRPRVVWIGVTAEPRLELLHHDVESACEELGFAVDGRPFRPHLTLARVKPKAASTQERRALSRLARTVTYSEEVVISSVDLMQSESSSQGPHYRVLASAPLRDA